MMHHGVTVLWQVTKQRSRRQIVEEPTCHALMSTGSASVKDSEFISGRLSSLTSVGIRKATHQPCTNASLKRTMSFEEAAGPSRSWAISILSHDRAQQPRTVRWLHVKPTVCEVALDPPRGLIVIICWSAQGTGYPCAWVGIDPGMPDDKPE